MNKFPIVINFTSTQWPLVFDRLDAPCAIVNALTDHEEGDDRPEPDNTEIWDRIRDMALDQRVTIRDQLDLDILIDAVEGSIMPAKLKDQLNFGTSAEIREARLMLRQIKPLERMLFAAGIDAVFPKF
jgi:hypothetical protein